MIMALLPIKINQRETNDLVRLGRDMDDLFRGLFNGWDWPSRDFSRWPTLDIAVHDDKYIFQTEVPGCITDDIDISVHNSIFVISGEEKEEKKKENKDFCHVERSFGSFRREVNLAGNIDPDKVHASCENGVLTVKLPKSEKAKPVKIKVKGQKAG